MPSILIEQPWVVGAIGAVITILSFLGWIQTGNAIAFKTGCATAIATVLLVLSNVWVTSDREMIYQFVMESAEELEKNDVKKILLRLHPVPGDRLASIISQLPKIQFDSVRVTRIHSIKIDTRHVPTRAVVHLNAVAVGSMQNVSGKAPRWIGLTLEKSGRKWLIVDLEEREPQHEFMNTDSYSPIPKF